MGDRIRIGSYRTDWRGSTEGDYFLDKASVWLEFDGTPNGIARIVVFGSVYVDTGGSLGQLIEDDLMFVFDGDLLICREFNFVIKNIRMVSERVRQMVGEAIK